MLVKVLRSDMLMSALRQFVAASVGDKFVQGGKIDLAEIFKESNSRVPIIFILSPGTEVMLLSAQPLNNGHVYGHWLVSVSFYCHFY